MHVENMQAESAKSQRPETVTGLVNSQMSQGHRVAEGKDWVKLEDATNAIAQTMPVHAPLWCAKRTHPF